MSLFVMALALAAAPDLTERCAKEAEAVAPLKKEGRYREARVLVTSCAVDACPRAVREYCRTQRDQLDALQPSVVISVVDAAQQPVNADLWLDGTRVELLTRVLLDPGIHDLRVEAAGFAPTTKRIGAALGENRTPILIVMAPAVPAPAPLVATTQPTPRVEAASGRPLWPSITGYVLAAGSFGTFTVLGLSLRADTQTAHDTCSPTCSPTLVHTLEGRAAVADAFLVTGSALTAIASALLWWWLAGQ